MISTLELFKIGIGPSSSHTVGPMIAAGRFVEALRTAGLLAATRRIFIRLHGSLAWTGIGHGTDKALIAGLHGFEPATVDPAEAAALVASVAATGELRVGFTHTIEFSVARDLVLDRARTLPRHSNALSFSARGASDEVLLDRTFYSIGGGFVVGDTDDDQQPAPRPVPHPFHSARELLAACAAQRLSIAELQLGNELVSRPKSEMLSRLDDIAAAMHACIDRGLRIDGELPGGLHVKRRAPALYRSLQATQKRNLVSAHNAMEWLSVYAIAVNEENAAGGRVVTAPTNGAAGIIPAVLRYFRDFCPAHGPGKERGVPADGRRDRQHHQAERIDLGRRGRMPGRSRRPPPRWPPPVLPP